MKITSIKINKIENAGVIKAKASIVLEDEICIHKIRVVEGKDGLFISFPYERNKKGRALDIVHPIKNEVRQKIQELIIEEYKKN